MKIQEVIRLAIDTSESGRPGAAVEILKSLETSLSSGVGVKEEFFSLFKSDRDGLVKTAQKIAFEKEWATKASATMLENDGGYAA